MKLEKLSINESGQIIEQDQKAFSKSVLQKRAGTRLINKEVKKAKIKNAIDIEGSVALGASIFHSSRDDVQKASTSTTDVLCESEPDGEFGKRSGQFLQNNAMKTKIKNTQVKGDAGPNASISHCSRDKASKTRSSSESESDGDQPIQHETENIGEEELLDDLHQEAGKSNHNYCFFIPDGKSMLHKIKILRD